jgi:hypothetical protein
MLTFATAGLTILTNPRRPEAAYVVRARLLCSQARYLETRAAAAVVLAKQLRAKLTSSWLRRFTTNDALGLTVVRCAWCGRMRTADGKLWLKSRASTPEFIRTLRVSHGMCPACKNQKWLSESAEDVMITGACVEPASQEATN